MNLLNKILCVVCTVGLLVPAMSSARRKRRRRRYEEPESYVEMVLDRDRFDQVLRKNDLVVGYTYSMTRKEYAPLELTPAEVAAGPDRYSKEKWSPRRMLAQANFETMEEYFKNNEDRYADTGEVKFVAVNFERGDLRELRKELGASNKDMLVFYKDQELVGKHELSDRLKPADIQAFLDSLNFEDFVESAIKREKRKAASERRRRRAYRSYYGSPYWGYGYRPYGYYGYRPGFSIGFGWGGGYYGHGRRYHRGWW